MKTKLKQTQDTIHCWVEAWGGPENVYVAFSGGKDSTVLLHIARTLYPNITAVFNNTGLELPEIVKFVRTFDNIIELRPRIPFHKVIKEYGWPVISKEQSQFIYQWRNTNSDKLRNLRWNGRPNGRSKISEKWKHVAKYAPFKIHNICCDKLKKDPAKRFEKVTGMKPMIGVMAGDSQLRRQALSCNTYDIKRPVSKPLLRWSEADVWEYINEKRITYCEVYNQGWDRTGCVFCMYGIHKDNPNRFQLMKKTHPQLYNYCINKLGAKEVLDFMKIPY